MAETYAAAELNIRTELKDEDDGRPIVSQGEIRRILNRKVLEVGDALVLHPSWVSSAITLVPGTSVYSLANTQEYGEVVELRYASTMLGLPGSLTKVSRERMQEFRNVTTLAVARPGCYSLEPQPDQTIRVVFDSSPITGENVDALVSLFPAEWGDKTDPAVATIPYSRRALRALELKSAASIGYGLNPEQLNALKLNPSVFGSWERDAATMLSKEWVALSRLRLDHGPTQLGWVLAWRKS